MKNGITKTKTNIWRFINQSAIQDSKWQPLEEMVLAIEEKSVSWEYMQKFPFITQIKAWVNQIIKMDLYCLFVSAISLKEGECDLRKSCNLKHMTAAVKMFKHTNYTGTGELILFAYLKKHSYNVTFISSES